MLESNPDLKTHITSITAYYFKLQNVVQTLIISILNKNNTVTDVSLYNSV